MTDHAEKKAKSRARTASDARRKTWSATLRQERRRKELLEKHRIAVLNAIRFRFSDDLKFVEKYLEDMAKLVAAHLTNWLEKEITLTNLETTKAKQDMAKLLNARLRNYGVALVHPETGEPCTLLAIADEYGGKYVLENRNTKKRSHTTRDLSAFLPLKLATLSALPEEVES